MSYYVHSYPGSNNQLGGSLEEIEVYTGPVHRYRQGGGGISRYLASTFRYFKPLLSSGINVLKDQGIKSAGTIINQLGERDVKSILKAEGENAINNLKQKAINKLKRTVGLKTQTGEGMPIYLHPSQARKGVNILSIKAKKKPIKTGRITKKKQKGKTSRKLGIKNLARKTTQFGGKKKKSLKRKQTNRKNKQKGGKKKKKSLNKRKKSVNNQLDIFS